jgi:hypothetical protein
MDEPSKAQVPVACGIGISLAITNRQKFICDAHCAGIGKANFAIKVAIYFDLKRS